MVPEEPTVVVDEEQEERVSLDLDLDDELVQKIIRVMEQLQQDSLTDFIKDAIVHYVNAWDARLSLQPPKD